MGFLDKLKDVAQSVADVADKAIEQKKETGKPKDDERLKKVVSQGSIKGDDLPKPKKYSLNFYIDIETENLIVFEEITGVMGTKKEFIREYPFSDIVAFKHDRMENRDLGISNRTSFYNTLVLSSGATLEIFTAFSVRNELDAYSLKEEMDGWLNISTVILTFISLAADEKTKKWINQFYIDCGGKAPFGESGMMSTDEYYAMHQEVFDKKKQEWEEKIQQIQ